MVKKRGGRNETTCSGTKNILLGVGKYTLATCEYAALASFGAVKAGGSAIKYLVEAVKKPVAKLNPAPPVSKLAGKLFKRGNDDIENIKAALEQRISMFEERLAALEQQRPCAPESIESQKKAIEREKLEILKQLVDINKSLKER